MLHQANLVLSDDKLSCSGTGWFSQLVGPIAGLIDGVDVLNRLPNAPSTELVIARLQIGPEDSRKWEGGEARRGGLQGKRTSSHAYGGWAFREGDLQAPCGMQISVLYVTSNARLWLTKSRMKKLILFIFAMAKNIAQTPQIKMVTQILACYDCTGVPNVLAHSCRDHSNPFPVVDLYFILTEHYKVRQGSS